MSTTTNKLCTGAATDDSPPSLTAEPANSNSVTLSGFKFGVDLIELSKNHVAFLRAAHAAGLTLGRPSAESFRRYSELCEYMYCGQPSVPPLTRWRCWVQGCR